ncbi:cadherin-like and PC-esterase domain-containing protein 1 isoform X2 [Branchiostoma floridae]|uniref:Cadherin-like and PC-esterase domain-containing protein 1 isoform X2 n=1 Tax=Branchiostoma floridae TaxID=7739 RepID=A0A9J7L668_BRAFL|nr:cadherin-like and PC-esterase domain-containing protein 1 isoform X2 [Branchiostoma floridae]
MAGSACTRHYTRMRFLCSLRSPWRDISLLVLAVTVFSLYLTYTMDSQVSKEEALLPSRKGRKVGLGLQGNAWINSVQRNILEGMEQEGAKVPNGPVLSELSPLQRKLVELEKKTLERFTNHDRVVVIRGHSKVIARDLSLYEQAFHKHGFYVRIPAGFRSNITGFSNYSSSYEDVQLFEATVEQSQDALQQSHRAVLEGEKEGWMVLLCMTFTDGDTGEGMCIHKATYGHLKPHQKVNRIPGVRTTLWRKDGFCHTMSAARKIPALRRSPLAPMCWVMPLEFEQFLSVADAVGGEAKWVFKSINPGGNIYILQPTKDRDYARIKQYRTRKAVVQQYFPNPLLIFGMPVSIRAYVLVTSVSPLRAFLHSEGLVNYRHDYQRSFRKVPSRIWYFGQLRQYLAHNHGPEAAEVAFRNMQSVITQTLLVSESALAGHFGGYSANPMEGLYKCKNCFQLLGFDLIYNSSLYPMVLEVNGQPHMQVSLNEFENETTISPEDEGWASNSIKQDAAEDMVGMLFSEQLVAMEVADALEELELNVGILGVNCLPSHEYCLTEEDLEYILDTRRETVNRGSFMQLYPSPDSEKYAILLKDLSRFAGVDMSAPKPLRAGNQKIKDILDNTIRHNTPIMHQLVSALEQVYASREIERHRFDELSPEEEADEEEDVVGLQHQSHRLIHNAFQDVPLDEKYQRPECNDDKATMPYLSGVFTEPKLEFSPAFSPLVAEYHVTVPYDTLLIKVWAFATSCDAEARLEEKDGLSRPANYSLGLGENRINFLVVDLTHTEPWVINTYTLHVYRERLTDTEPAFNPRVPHQVCTMTQDCDMRVFITEPCGLQPIRDQSWDRYMSQHALLPPCQSGDVPGSWVMPCGECRDKSSCHWSMAEWHPGKCRHEVMSRDKLQQCLTGKKVLFIGDSTNRGMMYYLMEQVNGTLTEWDKTHNIKVYNNLNNNRTSVSFAYYPQFWLQPDHRPVFDKALYQLMRRSLPLKNSSDTILVVGGVHWLATHHLNVVKHSLEKEGLTGVRVIMKSLGSGFHLPVDGIHCLSQQEQHKLLMHNAGLSDFARQLGFDVVETFNVTLLRCKDFLQGKCACHFHKVRQVRGEHTAANITKRETLPPHRQYTDPGGEEEDMYGPVHYHVEGDINALYSEILLNRICDIPR